ncbi:hypothetical protein L4444_00130, partial [Pseudomonas aeruginosa]
IKRWKTAGALAKPKGMTVYSNKPQGVQNAVFHSSPFATLNRLNAAFKSILAKNLQPLNWFNNQDMTGIG